MEISDDTIGIEFFRGHAGVAPGAQDHRNPGSSGGTSVVRIIANQHGFHRSGTERIENGMDQPWILFLDALQRIATEHGLEIGASRSNACNSRLQTY